MKRKIVGIFVCTLLIATAVSSVSGIVTENTSQNNVSDITKEKDDADIEKNSIMQNIRIGGHNGIFIPVIVNIYNDSNVNMSYVNNVINATNRILRQAGMRMVVVDAHGGDSGNPLPSNNGDAGGDGNFTRDERDAVRDCGQREVNNTTNQKGIKIAFGRNPSTTSTTPGVSVHRNPTIIVKRRNNVTNTAQTTAHEFFHVMTLCRNYNLTDINGDGDYDDPNERADANGHAPNIPGPAGRDNIMAPSNWRTGSNLTAEQIAEIRSNRYNHGKCTSQMRRYYPALTDRMQYGTSTDARGDSEGLGKSQGTSIYDIDQVFLTSLHVSDQTGGDKNNIYAQLTVYDILPETEYIDARYSIGFNTDADASTGQYYVGYQGIDKIVYIDAQGIINDGTFELTGTVYNALNGQTYPLPKTPTYDIEDETYDLDEPAVPMQTSFLFSIPKDLLDFTTTYAPAVATSGIGMAVFDITTNLFFDLERWKIDPVLETFGTGIPTPGVSYPYEISGLEPYDDFNLYLDDTIVASDNLDGSGGYSGSFIFPSSVPTDEIHFLTAQDTTGEFGYSITCPDSGDTLMLREGFESEIWPPEGWTQIQTTTEVDYYPCFWHQNDYDAGNGEYSAGLWWGNEQQDEWLITPSLDFSGSYISTTLEFWDFNFGSSSDYWEGDYVKVSVDGGETWDTLANLYEEAPLYPSGFFGDTLEFDLSDYIGNSDVKVAFHSSIPPLCFRYIVFALSALISYLSSYLN